MSRVPGFQLGTFPWQRTAAVVAATAVVLLLPFVISDYQTFVVTSIVVYSIALLGLNLLVGFSGQISIGHSAFFAIGAYTTAISITTFGIPYLVTIPLAGLLCLIVGFAFGWPALRLAGPYLAVATFALAIVTPQLLRHRSIAPWTGGSLGLFLEYPPTPFGLPLTDDQWLYFLCVVIAAILFAAAAWWARSRFGRSVVAVRDNAIAAESIGINIALVKTATFGLSAMLTGIAGALNAIVARYAAPDSFTFLLSITLLVGLVVGGVRRLSGALFGAAFVVLVPNWAGEISKAAPWAIYGLAVMLCVFLLPEGIAGMFARIFPGSRPTGSGRSSNGNALADLLQGLRPKSAPEKSERERENTHGLRP